MAETVVILGAGATKACKGPLTNEILPEVFLNKADFPNAASLTQLEQFLQQNFHVATGAPPAGLSGAPAAHEPHRYRDRATAGLSSGMGR